MKYFEYEHVSHEKFQGQLKHIQLLSESLIHHWQRSRNISWDIIKPCLVKPSKITYSFGTTRGLFRDLCAPCSFITHMHMNLFSSTLTNLIKVSFPLNNKRRLPRSSPYLSNDQAALALRMSHY